MDLETDPSDPTEDLYIAQDHDFAFADFQPTHHDTIFLIDSSQSMQTANEAGEVPFYLALQGIAGILKHKIVADTKDAVGVVILNSEVMENHMNFAGLRIIRGLAPAEIRGIKEMEDIANTRNGQFPPSQRESLLVEALWLAHDMFTRAKATAERSIYLLTDEDNPNKTSIGDQRRAIQRAKDLAEQGVTIEVFPFNTRGRVFDSKLLYSQLISAEDDEISTGIEKLADLQELYHRKQFRKRTLALSLCECRRRRTSG